MNTLVIPCAGGKMLGGLPSYLNKYPDGTLLARKAAESIKLNNFGRIVVPILARDDLEYNASKIIYQAFSDCQNFEVIVLPRNTRSAAETVYITIKQAKIEGRLIIKDSNNNIFVSEINCGNFVAGLNLSEYERDVHNLRGMSFVTLNDKNQVLDIIEKQICSENIGVGLYGFRSAEDFIFAYERLNDKSYPIQKLFISHIVSYLIGYCGYVFHYIRTLKFEDWSNEKSWLEIQNRNATYFVDLDALFGDDLDFEKGKSIIGAMQSISKNGALFVGFTSHGEEMKTKTKQLFAEMDVNCLQVVYGCSKSTKKAILENEAEIFENMYSLE